VQPVQGFKNTHKFFCSLQRQKGRTAALMDSNGQMITDNGGHLFIPNAARWLTSGGDDGTVGVIG